MQRIDRSMPLPFAEIDHRSAKRVDIAGIGELGPHLARRETGKLREGATAPLADIVRQPALVIGKIEEWARRAEFLPLEQHRDAGHQQEISGHRAKPARARQRVTALSGAGIGDLVVVLQKDDKAFRREVERRRAASVPLPMVALALIEETVLGGSNELARPTAVIRVVGFVMPGQRYHGAVMEVVVPQGVEPVTAVLRRTRQLGVLRLVLSDDKGASA